MHHVTITCISHFTRCSIFITLYEDARKAGIFTKKGRMGKNTCENYAVRTMYAIVEGF